MTQINIRIDPEDDEILTHLAKQKNVSKTVIARELLLNALGQNILPILMEEYKNGRIGIKRLIRLSRLPPQIILQKISDAKIEPPISESVDDYTSEVRDSLINDIKNKKILMKNPPSKRDQENSLMDDEISDI